MWIVRTILIVLVMVFIIAFVFYNASTDNVVDINLIFWQFSNVPMLTVVFLSLVTGIGISLLFFISVYIKQLVEQRSSRKTISALESEVTILRNRPIEESADLLKGIDGGEHSFESPFSKGEK